MLHRPDLMIYILLITTHTGHTVCKELDLPWFDHLRHRFTLTVIGRTDPQVARSGKGQFSFDCLAICFLHVIRNGIGPGLVQGTVQHQDGITLVRKDGTTVTLDDQLGGCGVYIRHVRLTNENFDTRRSFEWL